MDYNKYIKKLVSLNILAFFFVGEIFIFMPFIGSVQAATIPVDPPLVLEEFHQTDWSGGGGIASTSVGSIGNKYNIAEGASNLDVSGGSLKLKPNATVDKSYPTYNIIHQAGVSGSEYSLEGQQGAMFATGTNSDVSYRIQGPPKFQSVARFPQDRYTDSYHFVEPGIQQDPGTTEGLYYRMKVTLKKSTPISKIRMNLYDNDGRKHTRYMIKGSNDDVNYTTIVKMPDDVTQDYSGWQDITVSGNPTYKYFKFYFDGNKTSTYTHDSDLDVLTGDKSNWTHIKYLEIYDHTNTNIAQNWGTVTFKAGGSYNQKVIDGEAGSEWHHNVNTAGTGARVNDIDLLASRPLSGIRFYLYSKDIRRYFGYRLEVSNDNVNWTVKADRTGANADPKGYSGKQEIMFSNIENWRYIRLHGWKGAFSPNLTEWNWAGDTNFHVTQIEPLTPYHYAAVESPVIDFGSNREFKRLTIQGDYDDFGKEVRVYVRTGDSSSFNQSYWSRRADVMGNIPNYMQNKRYLQYKILLLSRDANTTPRIDDITISHKAFSQDQDNYVNNYSYDNHVPLKSDIVKPVESYRYNLGGTQLKRDTIAQDVDKDGVVDLVMLQGGRLIAKRWYEEDPNKATPYTDGVIWDTPNKGWSALIGLHDFNNDGKQEILVARESEVGGLLNIVDIDTGNILWETGISGHSPNSFERGVRNTLTVTDLENDGFLEVFVGGFGNLDNQAKATMYSFKHGFTSAPKNLVADGGNMLWEIPYIFRVRYDEQLGGVEDVIPGNGVKELVVVTHYYFRAWNALTGQVIGIFDNPILGHDVGAEDAYVLYPNANLGLSSRLFETQENYFHIFDTHIDNVFKGNTYSESFQKNGLVIDLGTQTDFTQIRSYFHNSSAQRQHNFLWEGSNNWDPATNSGTWTKVYNWQLDTYGNYNDDRFCQLNCHTTVLPTQSYRYLRLKGTGSKWYSLRGIYIRNIELFNNGVDITPNIASTAKIYVYHRTRNTHYSYITFEDVDNDNIKEMIMKVDRHGGQVYNQYQSRRGVYKFGNISDLKQSRWLWTEHAKDLDQSARTEGGWQALPVMDMDFDGKKDIVYWQHNKRAEGNWKTYIKDALTGTQKILKVKYQDQDANNPYLLHGDDANNYQLYVNNCPGDARKVYSSSEINQQLCEIVTTEFDTPTEVDKIDLKLWNGDARRFFNYRVEATEDLINWYPVNNPSTEGNTVANFTNWQTLTFPKKNYRAFRFYLSRSNVNAGAHLSRVRFFNGATNITANVRDKTYFWKSDGSLPGWWHSDSWMYGPIQNLGTDKVIPMYLGQRHGMYKFNLEKTENNQIYLDLMYNFNKTVAKNWTLYQYHQTMSQDHLNMVPYMLGSQRIPIGPIGDGSIGDFVITDGYNIKLINGLNGTLKTDFNYPSVGSNSLLYYGNLGKDEGMGLIQSLGDGKSRVISLTKNQELGTINTGNYFHNDIIVADMNNDGVKEVISNDGFSNRIVLNIAEASPIQSPQKIWGSNPGGSVYSTFDPNELVPGSDQGKDIVLTASSPLGIMSGSFTYNKHPVRSTGWEYFQYGSPLGDKESKWYYKGDISRVGIQDRGITDYWKFDHKNIKLGTSRNYYHSWIQKTQLQNDVNNWSRMFTQIHYFHGSQRFPYDLNNDGYDDFALNREYAWPLFISGKDGLPLKMIQHSNIFDWHPIVINSDDDPELELIGQNTERRMKMLHPKEGVIYESVVGQNSGTQRRRGTIGIIDINKDGIWEMFAQNNDGGIYIFDKDMRVLKRFYVYNGQISTEPILGAGFAASITSVDINSDGNLNLIIAANDGHIYAINPHIDLNQSANLLGEGITKGILWSYKVGAAVSRLAFADIRNRGKTDIIFSAGDGFLRVLTQASIAKPTKVNDGSTVGVNLEFTQDTTKIGANWNQVPGAKGYIIKFVSDTGQEIVSEKPILPDANGVVPTSVLVTESVSLQVGKKYFAMVKAFDGGGVSEYTVSDGIEVVGFNIIKKVRNATDPSSQFQDEITVGPGELVQYRITVYNRTNRIAGGAKYNVANPNNPIKVSSCTGVEFCEDRAIVIEDYMPQGFTYIAGSTVINGYSRSNETNPSFVFDGTSTQTSLPTVAGSVLRWKLPEGDTILPYGGTLELLFTARVK